jgi:hypothetical protein
VHHFLGLDIDGGDLGVEIARDDRHLDTAA